MGPPFVVDDRLVELLEGLVCSELRRFADTARRCFPDATAESIDIGEGVALFGGREIVFSQASGLGLDGPVDSAVIDDLDCFYREHEATSEVSVPSVAHESLMIGLAARGWVPTGFEDTLVLPLDAGMPTEPPDPAIDIRVVSAGERPAWGEAVAAGFAVGDGPGEIERRMGQVIAARDTTMLLWAWADGRPVATGELCIEQGVGWLSGDTTLPEYRGRGIQTALQRARIALAREAGCALAVSEAVPGGTSHRNMERAWFRVAYTRLVMTRRWESGSS